MMMVRGGVVLMLWGPQWIRRDVVVIETDRVEVVVVQMLLPIENV